jgi:hypothetical protein
MFNIVLLLVVLSIGIVVVMCLDFPWQRSLLRSDRRQITRHRHGRTTKP